MNCLIPIGILVACLGLAIIFVWHKLETTLVCNSDYPDPIVEPVFRIIEIELISSPQPGLGKTGSAKYRAQSQYMSGKDQCMKCTLVFYDLPDKYKIGDKIKLTKI